MAKDGERFGLHHSRDWQPHNEKRHDHKSDTNPNAWHSTLSFNLLLDVNIACRGVDLTRVDACGRMFIYTRVRACACFTE